MPDLLEHLAVKAWSQLRPKRVKPEWIEAINKEKWERARKSAIYRLRGVGLGGSAVIAKRCQKTTGVLEQTIYEQVLPLLPMPILQYYGFVEEPDGDFCWLFVEDAGQDGYSPKLEEHRALAGRWAGSMHTSAACLDVPALLPVRGPSYYLAHLRAACDTIMQYIANPALTADDVEVLTTIVAQCKVLASRWSQVDRFCDGMPQTLVHGDFKRHNVRVRIGRSGMGFLVFDWEFAGWGIPAEDLAGLQATLDVAAYWSAVRDQWPHLDFGAVQRLFFVGKVFRWTACVDWETGNLAYEWVEKPMSRLRFFLSQLAALLSAPEWESGL